MPGRLEFETEYENEAETLVKDMEFGRVYQFGGDEQPGPPESELAAIKKVVEEAEADKDDDAEEIVGVIDEPEEELELKLAVLEMFNERYDRRVASKDLIFDRGLMNYKTVSCFAVSPYQSSRLIELSMLATGKRKEENERRKRYGVKS